MGTKISTCTEILSVLKKYRVKDISCVYGRNCTDKENTMHYIFILESPHVDEIQNGIPLSGPAGKVAFESIFPSSNDSDMTLGRYIAEGRINASIINISDIPLQKLAYKNGEDVEDELIISHLDWKKIERIRQSGSLGDDIYSKFIKSSFQFRYNRLIKKLENDNYKIISCGRCSNKIVREVVGTDFAQLELIYHPAQGWWTSARWSNIVNKETANNTTRILKEIGKENSDVN